MAATSDRWRGVTRLAVPPDGVARARRCLGLTQARLAKEIGVGRVTVARWEIGVMRPTAKFVSRLLDLLADLPHRKGQRNRGEISERFAVVALFGGRVRLPVSTWSELLDVGADVLRGVPVSTGRDGSTLASGIDVGVALERRLRGTRRPEGALNGEGERRLVYELLFLAERYRG